MTREGASVLLSVQQGQGLMRTFLCLKKRTRVPLHSMARDEARHGKAFEGLLNRYFGK